MFVNFSGKVAVITGGSNGIGRACAEKFSKAGASIFIIYSNDDKNALKVKDNIESSGGYCSIIKGDVSDHIFCEKAAKEIINKFGKIDILINNAGISKISMLMDTSWEEIDRIIRVNLFGVINMTKVVLPYMASKKSGSIINISSMWGAAGASCESIYSASKGGINAFTKAMAKEMGPCNIKINAIAPGVINTRMNSSLNYDEKEELKEEIPLGRFGNPEEIADFAAFLVSDNGSYITGSILDINGGII